MNKHAVTIIAYPKLSMRIALLIATLSIAAAQSPVSVAIETGLGVIKAEIDTVHAPNTAANFLKYVDRGLYGNGVFHRTVTPSNQPNNAIRIEVIQAAAAAGRESEFLPPIALERTNKTGLKHLDGTLSMARSSVDSATSEFFICIGPQPELDFGGRRHPDGQGFAAFGKVTQGMDIVRKIQQSPAEGQSLVPPIRIVSIRRVK